MEEDKDLVIGGCGRSNESLEFSAIILTVVILSTFTLCFIITLCKFINKN